MADEAAPEKKNKKINKLTLAELEAAIKKTEEHMKGLTSKYAHALIARRDELKSK